MHPNPPVLHEASVTIWIPTDLSPSDTVVVQFATIGAAVVTAGIVVTGVAVVGAGVV